MLNYLLVSTNSELSLTDSSDLFGQITLDAAGAYSIIFSAFDKAGNYELARRLMIFDSTSTVSTMSNTHLRVTSAATPDYLWQQSLSSVVISWSGRYVNTVHNNNKWLNAVSTAYPDLKSSYDDSTGIRNTAAIDNVLGWYWDYILWIDQVLLSMSFKTGKSTWLWT